MTGADLTNINPESGRIAKAANTPAVSLPQLIESGAE
jgi:hypothetical protein